MEHQKLLSLLNEVNDAKFVTRKWYIFNDLSNANYNIGNEIIYNTEVLESIFCDYNDAYILVTYYCRSSSCNTESFKIYAPFTKCITKLIE